MPFDLIKWRNAGKDYGYDPMDHGFSKREISDTIRRMERLVEDLGEVVKRKEKEVKRRERQDKLNLVDWIGTNMTKVYMKEAYDDACTAAMDRAQIEFELPVIQQALKHAPEETPPLRHEDYYKRCQNLQSRRGEYWRENPRLLDFNPFAAQGAEGLGLRTPEKDKYWPTHQVPWQQGADSPPPLSCTPPTPPPRPLQSPPSEEPTPKPKRRRRQRQPPPVFPRSPPLVLSDSSPEPWFESPLASPPQIFDYESPPQLPAVANLAFLESGPLFTPPRGDEATDKDLEDLENLIDEVDAMAVEVMRLKSLAHDTAEEGSPASFHQLAPQEQEEIVEPEDFLEPQTETSLSSIQLQSGSPRSTQSSPLQLQLIIEDELDLVSCPNFLTPQVYSPDPDQLSPESSEGCQDWEVLDESTLGQGFSPEQFCVQEMENMMTEAVQHHYEAELVDPQQLQEAFSPEVMDDEAITRMLRGRELLISPQAQEGLRMMACEAKDTVVPARYGFMREEQWNERVCRWNAQEQRQREDERLRGLGAQTRQTYADSVFGVRSRGISAPGTPPRAHQLTPQTLPWGESPVDHISPPPADEIVDFTDSLDNRLDPCASETPPTPLAMTMPPSRLLYPAAKGGPTVSQPDLPSTSQCLYNTKRRKYEHLDTWATPPDFTESERREFFNLQRRRYEERLKPGPGVVAPKPTTPPPQPPPECGPEPEHMSVYVPETVVESPDTFKQRLIDSVGRFEQKLRRIRENMEASPMFDYYEQSPWVKEEYQGVKETKQEAEIKEDIQTRRKWDNYVFSRFGSVPSPDRWGRMRLPRTASTYRPRPEPEPIRKKRAPVNEPYEGPVYGPWLPWVYGSNRPPPKTAAGRISSPCQPSPKPAYKRPVETPPSTPRTTRRRAQPDQVRYGSARAPPKTAASYKYQTTPTGRPVGCVGRPVIRRNIEPSTPEMLHGSAKAPQATAASYKYQSTPTGRPAGCVGRPVIRRNIEPSTPEMLPGSARAAVAPRPPH